MKYPQLVSTRAVNAISDWLVSRLEQLGVEAPQIYTRLLLSLLQSTVQINDPIEFNNLETFGSRKGNHKRYPPTDTDTLKKLNAIQCLREIVSSDEEISTIESLVDELFEKLKDIEKQSPETADDENPFVVNNISTSRQQSLQQHSRYHPTNKHCNKEEQKAKSDIAGGASEKAHSGGATVADTDTDPKRRYFRAFPALSKEMEESFNIWRQNSKSLTWPMNRNSTSISASSSSSTVSTSFGSEVGAKAINLSLSAEKNKREGLDNCDSKNLGNSGVAVGGGSGGVKRKSRRRRNQAVFSKGNIQNIRKNSFGNSAGGSGGGKHHQRNPSLTYWDTDFEGCWEMGRDLIKEFIVKQNKGNRNRSTSESAAYNMKQINKSAVDHETCESNKISDVNQQVQLCGDIEKASMTVSPLPPLVDISFCDDDYDDTLASVSEITDNSIGGVVGAPHRRLYEREINGSSQELLPKDSPKVYQSDFAQFKAKFNSSIEALWKDANQGVSSTSQDVTMDSVSLALGEHKLSSMPVVAPFRENLKNFWSNYYNYQTDAQDNSEKKLPDGPTKMEDSSASLSCSGSGSALNNDFVNTSDYYSMPSNMDDFERSVGGARRERTTPISSMFFQNSIWSDNSHAGTVGDTDESFYYKVWNSSKKLNQLGVANKEKLSNYGDSKGVEGGHFPSYSISKWSEGINAGPHTLRLQQQQKQKHLHAKIESTDCVDAGCNPTTTTYTSNWETPLFGRSLQADLQSWSSSNPMSLTEMYGDATTNNKTASGGGAPAEQKRSHCNVDGNDDQLDPKPVVTLPNHSKETSGFVAYSRVKSFLKTHNVDIFRSSYSVGSINRAKDFNLLGDDENLLTSERTHFYPIKMFADGHTFDIRGSLDDVEYERSASGYLCFESDKYLEYTRIDNFMAEEDGTSTSNSRASTAPLYAASNCEAANDDRKAKDKADFKIRFRMRNNDIGCQTEDLGEQVEELPMFMLYNDAAQGMKMHGLGPIGNGIHHHNMVPSGLGSYGSSQFAANNNNNRWLPIGTLRSGNEGYRNSSVWTATLSQDAMYGDETEFVDNHCAEDDSSCSGSALEQQWSMREIGKKCLMKGQDKSREYESGGHSDAHTLWGMCAACNNDLKSVPANRLLRDELQLEADEIMSDLKYMQDLYIGRPDTEGEESEYECETDEYEAKKIRSLPGKKKQHAQPGEDICMLMDEDDSAVDGTIPLQPKQLEQHQQQPQTTDVLQRMNRLIADLLRPEHTAKKIAFDDTNATTGNGRPVPNGLWFESTNAKNVNVWRQNDATETTAGLQPMQLASALHVENDKFLTQLSWEHDNLAKIWQTAPQATQLSNESVSAGVSVACPAEPDNSVSDAKVQATVAYENLKNLQTFSNHSPPQSTGTASDMNLSLLDQAESKAVDVGPVSDITTTANIGTGTDTNTNSNNSASAIAMTKASFKRVQHLLNSNISTNATAKLKLANRKRRHSASQNLFHIPPTAIMAPTNNNNVHITDLNKINLKFLASNMISNVVQPTSATKEDDGVFSSDVNMDTLLNSSLRHALDKKANSGGYDTYEAFGDDLIEPKQTIITCKYWTTIEPMPECIDLVEEGGATFSCLLDKNASILKHVTMVTRPLTR